MGPEGGPLQLFRDILAYVGEPLREELDGEPLATLKAIEDALREALDHVPTGQDSGPHRLLHNYKTPLWDQLVLLLARRTIKRVLVVSPYFEGDGSKDDEEPPDRDDGSSFEHLFEDLRFDPAVERPVTVCFQENSGRTRLPVETIRRHEKKCNLRTLDPTLESRPLHAKLLLIEGAEADGTDPFLYAIGGSPNFTPAAFLRTPRDGNAELAVLTRLEGRRRTIARVEELLELGKLFPRNVDITRLRTIDAAGPPAGPVQRTVWDATLRVDEKKVRLSLHDVTTGTDRMRVLALVDGNRMLIYEVALGADSFIEFAMPAEFFKEQEGMPLALRANVLQIEFYRGSELLRTEDLPLNVDCADEFHGLDRVAPALTSLDARIAQAGAGVTLTYREQAKWLENLRADGNKGKGLNVIQFQADLDQFFRRVHTGLRGERERLKRNARSPSTIRRTLRDLAGWLKKFNSPDAALPSDECRMFLVERLAEETENLLRISAGQDEIRAAMPKALAEMGLASALDSALAWVRARDAGGAEEFQKQTLQAIRNAQNALNLAKG